MSNPTNQRQRHARHDARLAWLRDHPELLTRLPGAAEDVSQDQSAALWAARAQMVQAGLYSKASESRATRWGIRLLVSEIRGDGKPDKTKRHIGDRQWT